MSILRPNAARVLGVGVGAGGFIDFDSGRVMHSPVLDLVGVDLRTPIRAALRLPLILAGAIGTSEDVDTCLSAARDRLAVSLPRSHHRLDHWPVTPDDLAVAAAALSVDDVLRRPTSYLKSLI